VVDEPRMEDLVDTGDRRPPRAMIVVVGSSSIWAAGGAVLGRIVEDERTRRGVSVALAVLLVASVALLWV
jgi:hypothetical protein